MPATTTPCAGCCDNPDCPCAKECDETYCERHSGEKAKEWAAYFGIRDDMTPAERLAQVDAFRPHNWEPEA